jgi:hypothetical protein
VTKTISILSPGALMAPLASSVVDDGYFEF